MFRKRRFLQRPETPRKIRLQGPPLLKSQWWCVSTYTLTSGLENNPNFPFLGLPLLSHPTPSEVSLKELFDRQSVGPCCIVAEGPPSSSRPQRPVRTPAGGPNGRRLASPGVRTRALTAWSVLTTVPDLSFLDLVWYPCTGVPHDTRVSVAPSHVSVPESRVSGPVRPSVGSLSVGLQDRSGKDPHPTETLRPQVFSWF